MLGISRADSRTLLSVQSAMSSAFPTAHIPSVATALPSPSPVSEASLSALRAKVQAGQAGDEKQAEGNLLIVGVVNFGYLDFALNWLCFVRQHGIRNYLLGGGGRPERAAAHPAGLRAARDARSGAVPGRVVRRVRRL